MLDETIAAFPAEYQFTAWVTVFIALLIAAVWWFNRKFNAPMPAAASSPIDMKVLGAAFSSDAAQREAAEALTDIAATMRDIRQMYDRDVERGLYRHNELLERLSQISDGLDTIGPLARMRRPRPGKN